MHSTLLRQRRAFIPSCHIRLTGYAHRHTYPRTRAFSSVGTSERRTPDTNCFAPPDPDVTTRHAQQRLAQDEVLFAPLRRAGLAVLQVPTDFNMDAEAGLLVQHFPGVELRMQKITGLANDLCAPESFLPAARRIREAAEALKPADYCSVVGLACTSMSFTLGPEAVDR